MSQEDEVCEDCGEPLDEIGDCPECDYECDYVDDYDYDYDGYDDAQ